MSHRAGADRAAENQQTIKNLLKLEGNKVCADCKKNKRTTSPNIIQVFRSLTLSRSEMGQLERGSLYLHPMLRHPSRDGNSY